MDRMLVQRSASLGLRCPVRNTDAVCLSSESFPVCKRSCRNTVPSDRTLGGRPVRSMSSVVPNSRVVPSDCSDMDACDGSDMDVDGDSNGCRTSAAWSINVPLRLHFFPRVCQ